MIHLTVGRVPGVTRETEALKRAFDEGENVEAKAFPNVHTAASALKLWLRELPNSIVPEDM
jgi:RhoGAP domain